MKAQELNGTHIGKTLAVIVAPGPVTISGPLAGVRHEAARISERKVCQAEETFVLCRPDVTLTFIDGTSTTVSPEAKVSVSEEQP